MSRLRGTIARHPRIFLTLAGLALLGLVAVLAWFQPQKLFLDDKVDEALPVPAAAGAADEDATNGDSEPEETSGGTGKDEAQVDTLLAGRFRGLNHSAQGRARVIDIADGNLYLRFEDFEVENGPDLKVYLSTAPADSDDDGAFVSDFIDLGELKGNIGDQNYKLSGDVDLNKYRSAVIWCRRFSVGFAVAGLE
jgi:hypothetical protein